MKKIPYLLFFILLLNGCAPGQTTGGVDRRIYAGQWMVPQQVGVDTYLTEGYATEDAIKGGRSHCSTLGKNFNMIQLTPHTSRSRATMTFRCN